MVPAAGAVLDPAGLREACGRLLPGYMVPSVIVVLDALQLVHLDTSGLDALRQLHKVVLLRGGTLHLENLQEQPREVIERSGFGAELAANQASPEVSG